MLFGINIWLNDVLKSYTIIFTLKYLYVGIVIDVILDDFIYILVVLKDASYRLF